MFSAAFFYLGISYKKTKIPALGADKEAMKEMRNGGNFANLENLTARGIKGEQIIGKIIKINDNSITIELNDGGSNIIYITDETFIGQMENMDKSRLEEGQEILIFGSTQENQNVIAESIQIR